MRGICAVLQKDVFTSQMERLMPENNSLFILPLMLCTKLAWFITPCQIHHVNHMAHIFFRIESTGNTRARVCLKQGWKRVGRRWEKSLRGLRKENRGARRAEGGVQKGDFDLPNIKTWWSLCLTSGVPAGAGGWTQETAGGQQGLRRKVWWEFEKVGGEETEIRGGHFSGDCFCLHSWSRFKDSLHGWPCHLVFNLLNRNDSRSDSWSTQCCRKTRWDSATRSSGFNVKKWRHTWSEEHQLRQKNLWLAPFPAERKELTFFPISSQNVCRFSARANLSPFYSSQPERVFGRGE